MHALQTGANTIVGQTPYGCNRLYLNCEDKPLFVIRNLGDGRQQKLHAETDVVIDTYGRAGGGSKGHYRKQKEEKPVIVPGVPAKANVVREIFDLHYNQRLGGRRIANQLNERGVLSPTGKSWSQRQVESIYENPVYCGVALGNHVRQSIYHSRGTDRPEAVQHDPQVLATCQNAPRSLRPPDEWVWEDQPMMNDFLSTALRDKALTQIRQLLDERWQRSQDPTQPKRSPSKHKASEYVLTDLLFAKQDGGSLTGTRSGKNCRYKRYYRHRKGRSVARKGSPYNKLIPAEALEQSVLDLIRRVSGDEPYLRQRITEVIESQASHTPDAQTLADLRQQREAITKKVQLIVQTFDAANLADARPELDRLSRQRSELEQQIAQHEQASQYADEDPEAIATYAIARLASVDKLLTDLTPTVKRELVETFVERIEVDMATIRTSQFRIDPDPRRLSPRVGIRNWDDPR
ncbi:recombinase family protein [Phycisphaerales bacterium AB-hyl4]|uniref:Recombinase family protein n=1 Tax=Natronomicrosphaera hydrolytica TaxID=3242702 RepID=A0ABV4UBQ8_9BACT